MYFYVPNLVKKLFLNISILFCCVQTTIGQPSKTNELLFIDRIPLIIQSDVYLDTLLPLQTIVILTGKIKIKAITIEDSIISPRIITTGDYYKPVSLGKVEFNINGHWKSLSSFQKESFIDTVLRFSEKLTIRFRYAGTDSIIQQTTIKREERIPSLYGLLIKDKPDTLDSRQVSSNFKRNQPLFPGFEAIPNEVNLYPDKTLIFQVKMQNENKDSSLFFRILEGKESTGNWIKTGHIINLNKLQSNKTYNLEIKYIEGSKSLIYKIIVLPKWFEHTLIKVFLTLLFLAIVITIYFLTIRILRRRQIKARKLLEQQIRNLQAKLNPHFMFNVLGSISGLMFEDEKERAMASLNSFAAMLRETLDNSDSIFISLTRDIAMMNTYVYLEQLRFDFKFQLTVDPAINIMSVDFPPMLIQPSIENAIKHGIPLSGGVISVVYQARNKDLIVTIRDNGSGKPKSKSERKGHGISITRERMDNLQKLYPKIKMTYELSHTATGTIVRFTFTDWL